MKPKVTVFIPCYNYARYVTAAMTSVLEQSLADWEAIVIDDASTDDSGEVIRSFRDSRIKCIFHGRNKGNIATYNEAIAMARGQYVVGLSADDRYHREFLQCSVNILEKYTECAMSYTGYEIIDGKDRLIRRIPFPHAHSGVHDELPSLLRSIHIAQCSAMVRKSVYEEVGDFRFDRSGDWDMWLRIAKKHPIAFIRERLYQYRRHGANMSLDRRTLEATEQQDKIILDGILSDESVGSRTKPMRQQAYAAYFSRKARLRLLQADWRAGWWAYRDSLAWNARLALGPRNIGRLMVALAYGVLHGPKARS